MSGLHADLLLAISRLRVRGLVAQIGAKTRTASAPDALPFAARELLYEAFYLRPRPRPGASDRASRGAFVAALLAAHRSTHGWESGFQRVGAWRGRALVRRGGLTLHAAEADLAEGGLVRVPPVQRALLPGFLVLLGSTPAAEAPGCRIYCHLRPEHAAAWVEQVSATLEDASIPFRAKLLDDPASYWRADAGLVYLRRADRERALALLMPRFAALALRSPTPRFTLRLGPGVATADDPTDGQSFGESRCRFVADAVLASPRRSAQALQEALIAAGIDPLAPWSGP